MPFKFKELDISQNDKMVFSTKQETIFETVSQPSQAEFMETLYTEYCMHATREKKDTLTL